MFLRVNISFFDRIRNGNFRIGGIVMPVSFLPLIVPALLIGVPLLFLLRGQRPFLRAVALSTAILLLLFLSVYVPGWILMFRASRGDPAAMYDLARWTEKHHDTIGEYILWPFTPDVLGGYAWLEKAANRDYPPAIYALGVRIKGGIHVPRPPDWDGPGGNVYDQPLRGQPLIDRAIRLGYRPTVAEEDFYAQYRK